MFKDFIVTGLLLIIPLIIYIGRASNRLKYETKKTILLESLFIGLLVESCWFLILGCYYGSPYTGQGNLDLGLIYVTPSIFILVFGLGMGVPILWTKCPVCGFRTAKYYCPKCKKQTRWYVGDHID